MLSLMRKTGVNLYNSCLIDNPNTSVSILRLRLLAIERLTSVIWPLQSIQAFNRSRNLSGRKKGTLQIPQVLWILIN